MFSTVIVQPLRFQLKLHWLCYTFWVAINGWVTLCNLSSAVAKPHSIVAVVQQGIIMGLMLWHHVVICVCVGVWSPKETQCDAFSFLSSFFKFQFSLWFLYTWSVAFVLRAFFWVQCNFQCHYHLLNYKSQRLVVGLQLVLHL